MKKLKCKCGEAFLDSKMFAEHYRECSAVASDDGLVDIVEIKKHAKREIEKAVGLSKQAKENGNSVEAVAWNHTVVAYMDMYNKLEGN